MDDNECEWTTTNAKGQQRTRMDNSEREWTTANANGQQRTRMDDNERERMKTQHNGNKEEDAPCRRKRTVGVSHHRRRCVPSLASSPED